METVEWLDQQPSLSARSARRLRSVLALAVVVAFLVGFAVSGISNRDAMAEDPTGARASNNQGASVGSEPIDSREVFSELRATNKSLLHQLASTEEELRSARIRLRTTRSELEQMVEESVVMTELGS